ncbi:MAG: peptidoglycan-binding domain-containing protein, partial [Myxococcota bacterium]
MTSDTAAPQATSALRFRSPLGEWSIHPGLSTTTATGVVQGLVHFNSPIDDSALRAHDPELFAAIEGAERVLARGDSSPLLAPLAYLIARELRRPVPAHGALDGELLEQLEVLRRRNGLDGEAVIDAPLLALLRRQSAALDGGTTQRRAGVFGGALHHQVEAVLEGHSTLSAGTSGELVRRVQREVALQTGRNVVADGIFGQGTAGGIRAYQELRGLPTSGSVDAATMRALLGEYPEAFEEVPVARERVMVMIATNSEVPDELIRFRELARERGARPVILGGPDSDGPIEQLDSYLWMSHEDEIDLDWIVISGHSGGSSTWGTEGEIAYSDLGETLEDYPRAALKVETLSLLNCYNVTEGRATGLWTQMFPNIRALAGFMFSAPGVNAQNSDEMLLNSGRILLGLEVGETPDRATAEGLAHAY